MTTSNTAENINTKPSIAAVIMKVASLRNGLEELGEARNSYFICISFVYPKILSSVRGEPVEP
jgi:hypothetical protein